MSKITRHTLPLLCSAILAAGAFADTITLNSGERIEAKIASETATEITLDIQVSAGITDQRVVKKSDVQKIDRIAPDETAYRAIMNLQPGKNSLVPAQYEPILTALQDFAAKFPESAHAADVKQATTAFLAEKKRVDAGEVKLDGVWLSNVEAQKQRVQIGGLQYFNAMKNANASGDAIGALDAFAGLEKNFPGAKVMPDAVELARQILPALKSATERAIVNQSINEKQWALDYKNAAATIDTSKPLTATQREQASVNAARAAAQQAELNAAHQRELAKGDAALAAATAAGLWPPFATNNEKCLKAIQAKIPTEIARLEKIPVTPMRESIKLAAKAQTEFTNKDYAAATETLKEVSKLWPANELATRLTKEIADAKNPQKPAVAGTPAPETPGIAKAGAATPGVKPPGATPAADKSPTTAAAKPAAPVPSPAVSDNSDEPKTAEPEEPPRPFFMTVGGAVTIVVVLAVLLAGANIFNKLRRRKEDSLEE